METSAVLREELPVATGVADAKKAGAAAWRSEAALAAAAAEHCLAKGRTDLLLRFFDSEFFDEWIAVSYLWRTKAEGVRDYLCNRMYTLDEDRVENYLSQIVSLAILRPSPALNRLVVDLCSRSVRLACKVSWLLSAYSEDERCADRDAVRLLHAKCEEAALGGGVGNGSPLASRTLRKSIFQGTTELVRQLCDASADLVKVFPHENRPAALRQIVRQISAQVEAQQASCTIHYPLGRSTAQIVRIVAEETQLLNSREKAPFLLLVEVTSTESCVGGLATRCSTSPASPPPCSLDAQKVVPPTESITVHLSVAQPGQGPPAVRVLLVQCREYLRVTPGRRQHHRVPSDKGLEEMAAAVSSSGRCASSATLQRVANGKAVDASKCTGLTEKWALKVARLRRQSPFSHLPQWAVHAVIVKSGDDCRQELMAVQIVSKLLSIFVDSGLPLWLRPFEVLITSSHAALIEVITDAPSIHALKSRLPRGTTLRDHFKQRYGHDTQAYRTAQRNFVESMAGYSILSYLFQLKDRHNGNLLLDDDGHIIHIDFSFMLSYSPGGISFESAPFKLTRELLEVMDSDAEGCASDAFNYFKVLCIQGFLAARKHAEQILLLAEMMQGWNVPCFRGGHKVLQQLRKRFHLGSTEEQCVELVLTLIGDSLDAWCTRQYDYYQRVVNGIL